MISRSLGRGKLVLQTISDRETDLSGRSVNGFKHLLRQFWQRLTSKNANGYHILPVSPNGST